MAESEEYIRMLTTSEEMLVLAREMSQQDYSVPEKAMLAEMNVARAMAIMQTEMDFDALPEDIREIAGMRIVGAIPSMLAGQSGSMQLATSSVLSTSTTYLAPSGDFDNAIALLLYGDDAVYAAFVTFVRSGEGIITATGLLTPATEAIKNLADRKNISEADWVFAAIGTEIDTYEGDDLTAILSE